MSLNNVFRAAQQFVTNNTPGILTGLGAAGVVTTAVLTGKAGYTSGLILADEYSEHVSKSNAPIKDKAKKVWREFIPPAIAGVATVTVIIAANRVGSRRTAAIAAAFNISEKMAEEYKTKVVETFGKKAEEKVRVDLASDQMDRTPGRDVVIITGSDVLFFDRYSGRYFTSDIEKVRQAVNKINHQVNNSYYASMTDFYDLIGLERTEVSDEFGWNADELLEVDFTAVLTPGSAKPAIAISFNKAPIRGYDRVH